MHTFTLLFIIALAAGLLLQYGLLYRQWRHVLAHRDSTPAVFAGRITLEQHQKAADYTLARLGAHRIALALEGLLLLLWTLGGGLDWLQGLSLQPGWGDKASGLLFLTGFFFISGLLGLPLAVWRTFGIEVRFGFNRTTLKRFVVDILLQSLLFLAIGIPLAWVILWLMQNSGDDWWLIAWMFWIGVSLILSWIYPSLIAPLFNRFTPLQEGELKQRIQALLARCGFSSDGIFVMDGSKRSSHGNAYFTGFGRNKRIVFYDTLMQSLDADEIEAVLAHELGHFRRRHVIQRLLLGAVTALGGFALLGWLKTQGWFYTALGLGQASDAAALLLFMLVIPLFAQFFAPIFTLLMRRQEYEADDYAVEHASPKGMIQALVTLYRDNASTLTPDPWYSAFHDSHPPAPLRVAHISNKMGAQ